MLFTDKKAGLRNQAGLSNQGPNISKLIKSMENYLKKKNYKITSRNKTIPIKLVLLFFFNQLSFITIGFTTGLDAL